VFNNLPEEVQNFHGVIAERGNKYSALTGSEMIDAALHPVQGN
jgi:hypothetical protein